MTSGLKTHGDLSGPLDNGPRRGIDGQPRLPTIPKGPWWTQVRLWHKILLIAIEILVIGAIWQFVIGTLELVKDRKSTRLNSSHALISYAVFCLKKKKKTTQRKK